jgi:hypothetical protein
VSRRTDTPMAAAGDEDAELSPDALIQRASL